MPPTPALSRSSVRSRRIVLPLLVLIAGVAITIWSTSRTTEQADHAEQFVMDLCRSAARGESITPRLAASDRIVADQVQRSLAGLFGEHSELLDEISVEIAPGDTGPVGAGRGDLTHAAATHTAVIHLGDRPRLGLRLRYVAENDIRLIGCFEPQ